MKLSKIILTLIFAVTVVGTARGQSGNANSHLIPGYLNPQTNSFRPIMQPAVSPSTVSATTGKIVTSFTITVASAIPTTTHITCEVSASVFEQNPETFQIPNEIVDSATVLANRSGNTATCSVAIPYSWFLLNPGTDQAQLSYDISAATAIAKTTKGGSLIDRTSTQTFDIISVPASGAVTNETVQATI
jgi:hypothetical protein